MPTSPPSRRNGFVSVRAIGWAYAQRTGSTTAKAVLVALAKHADDDGRCYPGQEQLAWLTEMSTRSVRRALQEMQDAGLLTRQQRHGPNGHRRSDLYRLHMDRPPDRVTTGQSDHRTDEPAASEARPPDTVAKTTGQGVLAELTTEQTEEETNTRARDDFAEFWTIYPRRIGKKDASRAFAVAIKRASAETVLAGAHRLAADPNLPAEQFIPHPATWLRGDRWDDGPLPPRASGNGRPTRGQDAAAYLAIADQLIPADPPQPLALPGGSS